MIGPKSMAAAACVALTLSSPVRGDFRRGDANQDGKVDISDAVAHLRFLFRAGEPPPCEDASDSTDDGKLNIHDALATLLYLFGDGAVSSPGPVEAGPDPTCDKLGCASAPDPTPAVILSEVQYHPLGGMTALEYVELHNRASADLSLAGYRFTNGIDFAFPADAVIPAGGYLLVLKDPANAKWRRNPAPKLGPYDGTLADGGERLTLLHGDCAGETVKYADRPPWPVATDGSGPSMERVDDLSPADDFHSWRASTNRQGTPGEVNSSSGTPAWPVIAYSAFDPPQPTSMDPVRVRITLDLATDALKKVTLHWEAVAQSLSEPGAVEMTVAQSGSDWTLFEAALPAQASQTLVRVNVEAELADGRKTLLPHPAEPRAFLSYFAYDGEMEAKLPILWVFQKRRTGLPIPSTRIISALAIQEPPGVPGEPRRPVLVFDGADVRPSRQGQKFKFLKGEEYRGDRTLNMVPEEGGGGTGALAPHMEHLGFTTFLRFGAIAPRVDWFRVVDYGSAGKRHTQRLVIEQINQRFLEMNGLDPDGDLYKYVYQGTEKHTNLETGMKSLNDLLVKLRSTDPDVRGAAVRNELDLSSVGLYSVASVLVANWDGFHNNMYIYNDLTPGGRWKVIPWDLDQVFEVDCAQMPVTRPLTGEGCNGREPGVLSRPYHLEPDLDEAYREDLRQSIAPGGLFTAETLIPSIDAIEASLLDDLALQEAYIGAQRAARRVQIKNAYTAIRNYVGRRITYLQTVLGN